MVDTYTKFEKNGVEVEVNWNDEVKPCKFIKFKIGNEEAIIPNGDFYAMMMVFGSPEQQEILIPVKETTVKPVTSLLKIRAKKDIKKGEMITVAHTYFVSKMVAEKIKLEGGSGYDKLDRDILQTGKTVSSSGGAQSIISQ